MQKDTVLSAIPVLAVTAYAGKGDEERIRQAGARGYLSKPVSMMKFLESVRGIVD
jgi:two-component system, cell cycle response regulator DivK